MGRCSSFYSAHRRYILVAAIALSAVVLAVIVAILIWNGTGNGTRNNLEVARIPAVTSVHQSMASEIAQDIHVVIVGAGAAGMSAAYTLDYLNLNFTVLEAHPSIVGGRVRENTTFVDVPLDTGAEWIHVMPQVLQDLLLYEEDKQRVVKEFETMKYYAETASTYNPRRQKRNYIDWSSHFDVEYKFTKTTWFSYFETFFYNYIQDHVELGAVVTEIRHNGAEDMATTSRSKHSTYPALQAMTVITEDGREFSASHVLVTVPIPVLQDGDISFVPDFGSRTRRAINGMEMARGMKVYMEWSDRFYPDWQMTGQEMYEGEPLFFDAVWRKPTNRNILCLFNVNPSKAVVEPDRTEEEIVEDTIALLEEIFNRSDLQPEQTMVQNWSQEPYIRGAYTRNAGDYDQELLRQPKMNGHLFLAGEHLAVGASFYTATVHGAAITGREAVLKILESASGGQT